MVWADAGVAVQDFETYNHMRFGVVVSQELIDYVMPWAPAFKAEVREVRRCPTHKLFF